MFKTAHEGGFYKGPETERSMSKKRRKAGKSKRGKDHHTQNQTPISTSGISTEVGYGNQKPNSSLYGVKNLTTMKNPMHFSNTG